PDARPLLADAVPRRPRSRQPARARRDDHARSARGRRALQQRHPVPASLRQPRLLRTRDVLDASGPRGRSPPHLETTPRRRRNPRRDPVAHADVTFLLWSSGALGLRELWSYSFTRACATSESVHAHSTQTNPAAPLLLSSGAPERE